MPDKIDVTQARLKRLADLVFEAGMLRHIPRSGYAFLGSGSENVAEHAFRVAIIGHILAKMAGADAARVALLCLFHDLHEARTGDLNYVNYRYDTANEKRAVMDAFSGTGLEKEGLGFFEEFNTAASPEAALAKDADQIDLIANLQVQLKNGNASAADWIDSALPRLKTKEGAALAEAILKTDPNDWWRHNVNPSWWITHSD